MKSSGHTLFCKNKYSGHTAYGPYALQLHHWSAGIWR